MNAEIEKMIIAHMNDFGMDEVGCYNRQKESIKSILKRQVEICGSYFDGLIFCTSCHFKIEANLKNMLAQIQPEIPKKEYCHCCKQEVKNAD